ncbi:hypothetical protein BDCR2A_01389 [Borrelia duttonii CR2A]|uniref:Uncharacterized protein n=1 Tax=Borrelia duttonii CR2A TaxID=1432657 RepID=W6TKB9_9SPIR|nr:hypothetical protein BDCR2A_01389 [Borrelia duttonii CR2A]
MHPIIKNKVIIAFIFFSSLLQMPTSFPYNKKEVNLDKSLSLSSNLIPK